MSKSIKFNNDIYLDSNSVAYGKQSLNSYLNQGYKNIKSEVAPLAIYDNINPSNILVNDIEIFSAYVKQVGKMTFLSIILRTKTGLPSLKKTDYTPCCRIPAKYAPLINIYIPISGCYTHKNYNYPQWLLSSDVAFRQALCMINDDGSILVKTGYENEKVIVIQAVY